jgi:8-oxo-dGTP pyrophosphatase MutT (NUDIX family)
MAMPGGRQDPGDISVQAAAERETLEEVNVDLRRDARLLGQLDEVRAVARGREVGLSVAPFVYLLETAVTPQPNEEVQEALWVPLADLASEQYRSTRPYEWQGTRLLLPAWRWQDRVIWGLTYQMLQSLLRIIEQAWTEEPPD